MIHSFLCATFRVHRFSRWYQLIVRWSLASFEIRLLTHVILCFSQCICPNAVLLPNGPVIILIYQFRMQAPQGHGGGFVGGFQFLLGGPPRGYYFSYIVLAKCRICFFFWLEIPNRTCVQVHKLDTSVLTWPTSERGWWHWMWPRPLCRTILHLHHPQTNHRVWSGKDNFTLRVHFSRPFIRNLTIQSICN